LSQGLKTTFQVLSKTENEAAVQPLIGVLNSSHRMVREMALVAVLSRRSLAGHREVLRRLHTFDQRWEEIVREHRTRLSPALRDAVLGSDTQLCANGCRAVVWFHEYDLIPALVNALEDQTNANAEIVGTTLLELAETLYTEVTAPLEYAAWNDPESIRQHVISVLESSVQRFARHRRRQVMEAFLILVGRDNATLRNILRDPYHREFLALLDVLSKSTRKGLVRLLLDFLDDPRAPSAVLSVVAKRSDCEFVRRLLHKIGREPSSVVASNLKRMTSIDWLRSGGAILGQMDNLAQHAAVKLVMASGIPRLQAFSVIESLLLGGKPGGRRAAAEALEEFNGVDANALALRALDDSDPQVQANVLGQLRRRGIPGVLPRLVKMVDSPQAVVRQAARKSLSEFSFARFLGAFDMLDDDVRHSTGMLVKKIDPQTIPLLKAEMESPSRTRRLRALAILRTIDAVGQLESTVIQLLGDPDHMVRVEAAITLGQSGSQTSREALHQARADRSRVVQEAVQNSLNKQDQFAEWREAISDPRD